MNATTPWLAKFLRKAAGPTQPGFLLQMALQATSGAEEDRRADGTSSRLLKVPGALGLTCHTKHRLPSWENSGWGTGYPRQACEGDFDLGPEHWKVLHAAQYHPPASFRRDARSCQAARPGFSNIREQS